MSEIKFDKRNYRKHNDKNKELIRKSLEECGAGRSIVIDNDNEIVAGNGLYEQAKKLGIKTKIIETDGSELVVVKRTDLSTDDLKRKQLAIMDNSTSDSSEFDLELLQADFEVPDLQDFGVDIPDVEEEEPEVIEDEVPEEVETRCKRGDVWRLGNHRLMCGDSTSITDVEKLMDGKKADLLVTDPPYNVAYEGKTKDKLTIQNDKMNNDSFRQFLQDAFSSADAVMKEGAVFYIWHADSEGYNFRGACFDVGWKVRQCLIWNKNCMVMGRQDYQWKHEPCLYGWKDGASHLWASDRKQTTVIDFNKPSRNGEHPTMKPVGLFDYQIKNNTKKEDIVLDLFGGSGTTIIACEQNGRVGYSMELDEHYCDVIIQRWENLTGKTAERIENENN
jgi:site-specific DNA-methyltransferase (adenine-specific)